MTKIPRFRCVPEEGGTWTVWDDTLDVPARLDGKELVRLLLHRAEVACSILNRIELGVLQRSAK